MSEQERKGDAQLRALSTAILAMLLHALFLSSKALMIQSRVLPSGPPHTRVPEGFLRQERIEASTSPARPVPRQQHVSLGLKSNAALGVVLFGSVFSDSLTG